MKLSVLGIKTMTGSLESVQWSMKATFNIERICCGDHCKTK